MRILAINPPSAVTVHDENGSTIIRIADAGYVYDDGGPTGLRQPSSMAGVPSATPGPDAKPYRSEIRIWVEDTNHKLDANGNVLAPDGSVYTKPDLHAPLDAEYASVQALQDDASLKNWPYPLFVDGFQDVNRVYGAGLAMYGAQGYSSLTVPGKITRMATSPITLPPPQVNLPPAPAGSVVRVAADLSGGQMKIPSNGITTELTEYTITPAHLSHSQYDGFVRVVEAPGSERSAKTLIVSLDGREVFNSSGSGDPAPQCNLTLSQVAGVSTITATVQNAAYVAGPADHHIDIALAGR